VLGTTPLQGSLAGEPGQDLWPEADLSGVLMDEARTSAATDDGLPAAEPPAAHGPAASGADESADLGDHTPAPLEAATDLAESLGLGFHLGAAVERIARGASEGRAGVDRLREASWLIERYIALVEQRPSGADMPAASVRLGRSGEAIAGLRAISAALEAERATVPVALDTMAAEPVAEAEPAPPADTERMSVHEAAPEHVSFGREVALMAVRWALMVLALVLIVLALTLIGERF
jgi:hypothetical protein